VPWWSTTVVLSELCEVGLHNIQWLGLLDWDCAEHIGGTIYPLQSNGYLVVLIWGDLGSTDKRIMKAIVDVICPGKKVCYKRVKQLWTLFPELLWSITHRLPLAWQQSVAEWRFRHSGPCCWRFRHRGPYHRSTPPGFVKAQANSNAHVIHFSNYK
jgi:hypothetical protein